MQFLLCLRENAKDLGPGVSGFLGETIFEPTAEVECDSEELVYL
jgi:hypothetical protein